jgi:hypothetical protein
MEIASGVDSSQVSSAGAVSKANPPFVLVGR